MKALLPVAVQMRQGRRHREHLELLVLVTIMRANLPHRHPKA
jgi:hypothetical protein